MPECLLNPPEHESAVDCAAVAAGNVETSQRVVDVLLGAPSLAAASQGTMNNFIFGIPAVRLLHETICGGGGATSAGPPYGSAVHTHMTNTRITDPEVLERRLPFAVLLKAICHSPRFGRRWSARRRGWRGAADRVSRIARCLACHLAPRALSAVWSVRRSAGARLGLQHILIRAGSTPKILPSLVQFQAEPGDQLVIETPGGGGWGQAG